MKNFIEVNGSDRFNIIFDQLIENMVQMKLKIKTKSGIKRFFKS